MEKYLEVVYSVADDTCFIGTIFGISLNEVLAMQQDILDNCYHFIQDNIKILPNNAIGIIVRAENVEWNEPERGNYPPPNIELPGYFEADYRIIAADIMIYDDWVYVPKTDWKRLDEIIHTNDPVAIRLFIREMG